MAERQVIHIAVGVTETMTDLPADSPTDLPGDLPDESANVTGTRTDYISLKLLSPDVNFWQ